MWQRLRLWWYGHFPRYRIMQIPGSGDFPLYCPEYNQGDGWRGFSKSHAWGEPSVVTFSTIQEARQYLDIRIRQNFYW